MLRREENTEEKQIVYTYEYHKFMRNKNSRRICFYHLESKSVNGRNTTSNLLYGWDLLQESFSHMLAFSHLQNDQF